MFSENLSNLKSFDETKYDAILKTEPSQEMLVWTDFSKEISLSKIIYEAK